MSRIIEAFNSFCYGMVCYGFINAFPLRVSTFVLTIEIAELYVKAVLDTPCTSFVLAIY
jgi:hypothetical protein